MTDAALEPPESTAQLLESFRPQMVRFAFWLSRDRSVAEDLVQETFLRAWRSREELRAVGSIRPWLLTIVRREHARMLARKRLPMVDIDACTDADLGFRDEDPELNELRRAMLNLPAEYSEPLVMQVLGGFSTDEIARELSLTVPTVLTRLFRARNKLREAYGVSVRPGTGQDPSP